VRTIISTADEVMQDVRYGARVLRGSPWFTLVGVASLAIGLGSAVALFTIMNAAVLRPLPGRNTSDLQTIFTSNGGGGRYGATSLADFQSFISSPGLFSAACATTNATGNFVVGGRPQGVAGAIVSGGCFEALGIRPHLGRLLNGFDDAAPGGSLPVVIGHRLWRQGFDGDAGIVGRETLINGYPAVIVGVAEAGFGGVSLDAGTDFWAPLPAASLLISPATMTARGARRFHVYVRLQDGVSQAQASERLAVVAAQLRVEEPRAWTEESGVSRTVTIMPERSARFAGSSGAVAAIVTGAFGAIAIIVAIACINLATMVMVRGAGRTYEFNVRLALGASRGRLLRQLATEALLMSAISIALGVVVVYVALRLFDTHRPVEIPSINMALDWRVNAFSLLLALAAPVLFGLAPGAHALRLAIAEGLKGRPTLIRRRFLPFGPRELLLVIQVTLSFALLVMAALFTRSLMSTAPGYRLLRTESVAVVSVDLNTAARTEAEMRVLADRLLQAADRLPEVDRATAAMVVPMTGSILGFGGFTEDRPDAPSTSFDGNLVTPGYFELLGIALRTGRTFDDRDHASAPHVAIVSESLARQLWGTPAGVGRNVRLERGPWQVVGVVADVPYHSSADTSEPILYLPLAQLPPDRLVVHALVKNEGEAIVALDRALRDVDPRVVVGSAMPLRQRFEQTKVGGQVAQGIGAMGGLLQLGLALMATWALVAYSVQRRTQEIAIRRALGATEGDVLTLVMKPSLWLLAVGSVVGCAAGAIAAKAMYSSFLGLAPIDLRLVIPAAALTMVIVLLAAWLPARRAAAIEPASALKTT
jgi:predicted permease